MSYENKAKIESKVYTSSIPEIAEKQYERRKEAVRSQLPLIVECLLEDDGLLQQVADAIAAKISLPDDDKAKKK